HFGVSAVQVFMLYLAGAFFAGVVVAGMQPVIHGSLTATLVATIAFLPSLLIARVMLHGSSNWRVSEMLGFIVVSLFLGALWGPSTWRYYRDGDHDI
ncbi:MAG TPA: hypothetical protein VLJ83_08385, partial [Gemmatimonadaceae bacterium]|nr:hypothetical protein [Gemmatimonadaceae bacterium]